MTRLIATGQLSDVELTTDISALVWLSRQAEHTPGLFSDQMAGELTEVLTACRTEWLKRQEAVLAARLVTLSRRPRGLAGPAADG